MRADRGTLGENKSRCIGLGQREEVRVAGEFSSEFYNYFMPLDLQSIINYLLGFSMNKVTGREMAEKKKTKQERERAALTNKRRQKAGELKKSDCK